MSQHKPSETVHANPSSHPEQIKALKPEKNVLNVQFADRQHRQLLSTAKLKLWIKCCLTGFDAPYQLTLRFVNEKEGAELNKNYRKKKDYATNVLTFAYTQKPVLEADIVLCSNVIAQEAALQQKPLEAHYAHLIVHGVLHALGMQHERLSDAKRMMAKEIQILKQLGIADPYLIN